MTDDATLLARYAAERSEEAFAAVVQRHLPLVYSAALRRTNGDRHRAEDVAQVVFTTLARRAGSLAHHTALTGWLYTATRHAAIDIMRAEYRRHLREQKAHAMHELSSAPESAPDWEQLRPVLDGALDQLDPLDREAVLLRFFQQQPFAAIAGVLRVNEDAARKRVERAVEKLRALLARRGITSSATALGAVLTTQGAVAVPAGVAATITSAALASAGAAGAGMAGFLTFMSTTKIVTGVSTGIAIIALGIAWQKVSAARTVAAERDELRGRLIALEGRARQSEQDVARTQKELADLRAASPASPARAEPLAARPPASTAGAQMNYVLEHPETHAAFVQHQVLLTKERFAPFFHAAGLTAEKQEQFLQHIKEWTNGELDLMSAKRAQGYDVSVMPADPQARAQLQQLAAEKRERLKAGLRDVLGDALYQEYQDYGRTVPERNVTDHLASQLYRGDAPLSREQAEQLTTILAQHRFTPGAPGPANSLAGAFIEPRALQNRVAQVMQQSGMTLLDWHAPVTDAAVDAARAVLTPPQIAALKHVQAQQAMQFQLAPPPPSPPAP